MSANEQIQVKMAGEAYRTIRESLVRAANGYEVGGILLGYEGESSFRVIAVTSSVDMPDAPDRSRVSFVLDGDWHTRRVEELSRALDPEPQVLGVWHSHICDGPVFSGQDRESNQRLAECFEGIVSLLAVMDPASREVSLTAFYVEPTGAEFPCAISFS